MTVIMGLMNTLTINESKIKIIVFEFFLFVEFFAFFFKSK